MQYQNVLESSPIYDSIVVCHGDGMYGSESEIPGWFNTFALFGQRQEHGLFKTRTEAIAGLPYNNQQVSDRTDFAFRAYSIGISFWGPPGWDCQFDGSGTITDVWQSNSFWMADLPNASGIEFRVGQDVILAEKCLGVPPGYGASGNGFAMGNNLTLDWLGPCAYTYASQGVPHITNRFDFIQPVAIPRNATIECKLMLSEYVRNALAVVPGPGAMYFANSAAPEDGFFKARYGITASLYGIREVQQRGALSAQ